MGPSPQASRQTSLDQTNTSQPQQSSNVDGRFPPSSPSMNFPGSNSQQQQQHHNKIGGGGAPNFMDMSPIAAAKSTVRPKDFLGL